MHRRFPRLHAPLPTAFVSPDSEILDLPPDYFTRRMSGHSLREIRSVRSGTEISYSPSNLVFPASITSLMVYTHLHLHTAHVKPKNWRSLGTFK